MNTIKPKKTISKLHPSEYANVDTGELLSSETKEGISISMKEKTNQFIINSDEYVVFDSNAIQYLIKYASKGDVTRVFTMSDMVKGDCSIICQGNNHPHTPETLCGILNLTINEWYVIVRRLVKLNILAYTICAPSGYVQKIYMLNPYIARKRKTINCELNIFFRDVTKDA